MHTIKTFTSVVNNYITDKTINLITDEIEKHIKESAREFAEAIVNEYGIEMKATPLDGDLKIITLLSKAFKKQK